MSTRIDTTPPRVPTVTVRALPVHEPDAEIILPDRSVYAVVVTHRDDVIVTAGTHDAPGDAERVAAVLRGMLADAYLAGKGDERDAWANADDHRELHVKCDETITALGTELDSYRQHTPTTELRVDEIATAWRVEIDAVVEARTAEEAQEITGRLLAGMPGHGHERAPLTGPGSFAPNVKRITVMDDDDRTAYQDEPYLVRRALTEYAERNAAWRDDVERYLTRVIEHYAQRLV